MSLELRHEEHKDADLIVRDIVVHFAKCLGVRVQVDSLVCTLGVFDCSQEDTDLTHQPEKIASGDQVKILQNNLLVFSQRLTLVSGERSGKANLLGGTALSLSLKFCQWLSRRFLYSLLWVPLMTSAPAAPATAGTRARPPSLRSDVEAQNQAEAHGEQRWKNLGSLARTCVDICIWTGDLGHTTSSLTSVKRLSTKMKKNPDRCLPGIKGMCE